MRTHRFFLKTEIVFGVDALNRLEALRGRRVGIITDAFMAKSGVVDRIKAHLPQCAVKVFSDVTPEPPIQDVKRGIAVMDAFAPDAIIALGGGSSIDAAKAIVAAVREMETTRPVPLVAVPTTSGTGSEVTEYAVISEPERGLKHPLRSEQIIPDMALLDPGLVRTVPAVISADTGMDVITHALEAYVAVGATDFSDAFAEKALRLAVANLQAVCANGEDMSAREAMHNASCMAGLAFNAAGLGLAHGLSHAIGGRLHLPHGRLNAILLPLVIEFNAAAPDGATTEESVAARYAEIARQIGVGGQTASAGVTNLVRTVSDLSARCGIPASLRKAGADIEELVRCQEDIVATTLADTCTAANPRQPTPIEVASLLRRAAG